MPRRRTTDSSPILSASELADLLAVDRHTIVDSWIPMECPVAMFADATKGQPWGFNLADVVRWRVDNAWQFEEDSESQQAQADYEIARARKTLAQAQTAELTLEQRRGRLVSVDDVADAIRDEYAKVRSRLMALPASIAMQSAGLDATAMETVVKRQIGQALEELAADRTCIDVNVPADDSPEDADE